ncbi:MAG: TolC family protein [Rickettsiales bacterium]
MSRFIKICIFIIIFNCNILAAKTLTEVLNYSLVNNSNILLEQARLENVRATKQDGLVGFLPNINASYQRGRKKDDVLAIERANNLDKMSDQDIRSFNISQPIFQGFRNYYKIKEINANIAEATFYYQYKRNEILLAVIEAYFNLYKHRKIISLYKDNISLHEKLLSLIRQRNDLGELAAHDLVIYEEKLFNILLENMEIRKELFKAEQEYTNLVGHIDFDLEIDKFNVNDFPTNQQAFLNVGLASNPNLKRFKEKTNSIIAKLKQMRGAFSPNIELVGEISEQQSVTYLNNRDLRSESLNFNVTIPIFQKGSEYFNLHKINKELSFAKQEYQVNYQELKNNMIKIYKEYSFYEEMLEENQLLLKFKQDKITALNEQVRHGVGDIIDLLNAKIELKNIEVQEINNQINYYLSYYKILFFTNKIAVKNEG